MTQTEYFEGPGGSTLWVGSLGIESVHLVQDTPTCKVFTIDFRAKYGEFLSASLGDPDGITEVMFDAGERTLKATPNRPPSMITLPGEWDTIVEIASYTGFVCFYKRAAEPEDYGDDPNFASAPYRDEDHGPDPEGEASAPDAPETTAAASSSLPEPTTLVADPCSPTYHVRCPDCGAAVGSAHAEGCDVEQCTSCKGQRLMCCCADHEPLAAVWNGEWPGVLECRARGWFVVFIPNKGFLPCDRDTKGASEDLNRWATFNMTGRDPLAGGAVPAGWAGPALPERPKGRRNGAGPNVSYMMLRYNTRQ